MPARGGRGARASPSGRQARMIRINLAPPPEKTRMADLSSPVGLHLGLVYGALFLLLVGALGAYWWKMAGDVATLEREIAANEREKAGLQKGIVEGQRFKQETSELERRVNAMADMVPADVWLTRIEEKGQQLRLAGAAYSPVAISDFMSNLKASGRFRDVDLVESRQDLAKASRLITFEVSCR